MLDNWPAYLAAFITIGIIWLKHNEEMARLGWTTPITLVLNLGLLLSASLVPWPTALLADALGEGDHADQFAAMVVFAIGAAAISVPWVALDLYRARPLGGPSAGAALRA